MSNLLITSYKPDSLRTFVGMGTPSMRTQEISTIPQLDGPGSLPMKEPIGRRVQEISRSAEQEYSQGSTYVWKVSVPGRREYPGGDNDDDGSGRLHRDWRSPERGRYPNQGGGPPDQRGYSDRGTPGDEGPPGRRYPHRNGRPPGRGGYQISS